MFALRPPPQRQALRNAHCPVTTDNLRPVRMLSAQPSLNEPTLRGIVRGARLGATKERNKR